MKSILILSDIHAGSMVGPMPDEYYDRDYDYTYTANTVQSYLFGQWRAMADRVGHVDICIVNGDVVEGVNRFEEGIGVVSTNMMTQCGIAKDLLSMLSVGKFYFTSGSGYHTKKNTNHDRVVCDMMHGEWIGTHGFINVEEVKIHARHWQSYSSVPYGRCTAQRKEAYVNRTNGMDIDVYVRSHTHRYYYSGDSNDISINTPSWKGLDDWMNEKSQEIPDNGYVRLNVDGINYNWDAFVFNIPLRMYSPTFTA